MNSLLTLAAVHHRESAGAMEHTLARGSKKRRREDECKAKKQALESQIIVSF